ncbi:MAG: hypothetical protein HW387_15 [Parachlamydiales bacterium]|nr:hypothetical protein [Parachlamydiales bacterium]
MSFVYIDSPVAAIHAEINSVRTSPDVIAIVIKVPPPNKPPAGAVTFNDLECTVDDIQKISEIISKMGEKSKLYLLAHESYLRKIGDEVRHVHPLKFLSVALSNPYLKSCMVKFRDDYFKWHNFIIDLQDALNAHSSQGNVSKYLNDFAKTVGVAPEAIQKHVDKREWVEMIDYILTH